MSWDQPSDDGGFFDEIQRDELLELHFKKGKIKLFHNELCKLLLHIVKVIIPNIPMNAFHRV
jgi:hypothetical protein